MWKRNQDKLGSEQVESDSQQSLLRARADPKDLFRIERDGVDVQSSEGKESSTRQERRPFQRGDGDVRRRNSRSQSPKRRGRSP